MNSEKNKLVNYILKEMKTAKYYQRNFYFKMSDLIIKNKLKQNMSQANQLMLAFTVVNSFSKKEFNFETELKSRNSEIILKIKNPFIKVDIL